LQRGPDAESIVREQGRRAMGAFVKKYRNDVPCFVISRFLCYEVDVVQGVFEAVGDKGKEQGGARMGARKVEQFIYIVGEH